MTDPTDSLKSFQETMTKVGIELRKGKIDPNLYIHLDYPNNIPRFTYVRIQGTIVTSMVLFVQTEPIEGIPCFQIGYAVPEKFQGKGFAKDIVNAAIIELRSGFSKTQLSTFYIEAVIGKDNASSNSVAQATLSKTPSEVTDSISGQPAFHYLKKVSCLESSPKL